jgi:serralysin
MPAELDPAHDLAAAAPMGAARPSVVAASSNADPYPLPDTIVAGGTPGPEFFLNADARAGATDNGKPSLTIDQAASQIVRGEPGWSAALGQPFTVTFAFRADAPATMPNDTGGFQPFNTAQIDQALLALQAWSDVANIKFVRVGSGDSGPGAYSDNATILFGDYTTGEAGAAAFGNFPGDTSFASSAGDVWVNSTLSYNASPTTGNYGGQVLVHELGHAIGLDHPSDYNAEANVTLSYATDASYYEDDRQYSVMSYFSETSTGANYGGLYSAAPLLDDIAAAQLEYGANMTTRTGDTVYGFNSNTGLPWYTISSSFQKAVFAVWDAGGNDTLDFSGYSQAQTIDLRPGFFSSVGGLTANVAIAQGANIENAIGGSGPDLITGNTLNNSLTGGGGNDTLVGGGGTDTAIYSGAAANYARTENADGSSTISDLRPGAPDGVDTLIGIDILKFSDQSVVIAVTLPSLLEAAFLDVTRTGPSSSGNITLAGAISADLSAGTLTQAQAVSEIVQSAAATSSVATLAYEFFTGSAPSAAGMDFLVSPTGPNANNLNSAYYQSFGVENRYINFAVNLGKVGAGEAAFNTAYGALSLFDATRQAYTTIFGGTPSDTKLHALLDPLVPNGLGGQETRADYFASYGGDGPNGLGTKAAMVGWLLAEAEKADVGTYALSNDAFLTDVALHNAPFGVDLVGHYSQASFVFNPG